MRIALGFILVFIYSPLSWGVGSAGFTNQIVGAKAFGMGNAFVALADDPSAVFFNPAGLTQLNKPSVSLGLAPILPETDYDDGKGTTLSAKPIAPVVPYFYATLPLWEGRGAAGFGFNTPFGLETRWR